MHGPLRVPHQRWTGRNICGGCHDRSLWRLWDDVVVGVHLHEGRVEGSGHLATCSGVHVLYARMMLVGVVAMRDGAANGGERSSPRARLRRRLLAFVEYFLHLHLVFVLFDEE